MVQTEWSRVNCARGLHTERSRFTKADIENVGALKSATDGCTMTCYVWLTYEQWGESWNMGIPHCSVGEQCKGTHSDIVVNVLVGLVSLSSIECIAIRIVLSLEVLSFEER